MKAREGFGVDDDLSRKGFGGKSGPDGDWGPASSVCSDMALAGGAGGGMRREFVGVGVSEADDQLAKKEARTSGLVIPRKLSAAARRPLNELVNIGVALRWQSGRE
jgi:hypothetical protein